MNKAFELILERLDKCFMHDRECDYVDGLNTAYFHAKAIVREVAEEYNITNGDKIRYMNDEELAEFLVNFKKTYGDEYEGEMSCLDWLKSEAKNYVG